MNTPGPQPSIPPDPSISQPSADDSRRAEKIFTNVALGLSIVGIGGGIFASQYLRGPTAAAPSALSYPLGGKPPLSLPRPLADFTLTNTVGTPVSRADLVGKFLVVNFVFTSCSLSCLAVNQRMEEIQSQVAGLSDVRLVSLTIDPRTDTPGVLGEFARRYHADPNRWHFLTGEKAVLYPLIEASFLPVAPDGASLVPGGFQNTDRIMLVDRSGTVRAAFNGLNGFVAAEVCARIKTLRTESPAR